MTKLSEWWKHDDTARWLGNGVWLCIGLSTRFQWAAFLGAGIWVLRAYWVFHLRRAWEAKLLEAERKGLFGGPHS